VMDEHSDSALAGMPVHPPASQLDETWKPWTVQIPAWVAGILAGIFGTAGYSLIGFGIMSTCTDHFSCGYTCAPCAAAGSWLNAGGIGQWVLVAAVIVLLRPGRRKAIAISIWGVIPLACGWIALTTAMAQGTS
jgi:hypothetical protein